MALLGAVALSNICFAKEEPLVIHEWGTFTSLQDETGSTIGGINTDDEPVPRFVHRLSEWVLLPYTQLPPIFFQGAPRCHSGVTMRLETPVLYFHPPASWPRNNPVTVQAKFRGGWLTEFYPQATADAPGLKQNTFNFGQLTSDTIGTLTWKNLMIGVNDSGPKTTEHVWTAPRDVKAATVKTENGESEKFLFYRGVGHIDAPLQISQDDRTETLTINTQLIRDVAELGPIKIEPLWLVNIRPDGKTAVRGISPVLVRPPTQTRLKVSSHFSEADFSTANLATLKESLKKALERNGLFDDEAQALLDTWELSYFKSPGLRLFFIVPNAWVNHYLPLEISVPAKVERVMVGRIELITQEQRNLLQKIAKESPENIKADAAKFQKSYYEGLLASAEQSRRDAASEGRSPAQPSVSFPASYQAYLDLGRFRNTLLLEEQKQRPAAGLAAFINAYNLVGYTAQD